jgi:hypothetical protein
LLLLRGRRSRVIKHIVFFRFKASVAQPEREAFLGMLNALPVRISEISAFQAGSNVVPSARAFDMALVADFADLAALERYGKHPDHQPVIQRSREICEQTAAVDYSF